MTVNEDDGMECCGLHPVFFSQHLLPPLGKELALEGVCLIFGAVFA